LSFEAYIEGFKYCRLVINIDGTHLYGRYDEKLLITIAFDANNRIFSLFFTMVDKKIVLNGDGFCFAYRNMLPMIEQVYV